MDKKEIRKIFDYALEDLDQIILNNPKYNKTREICSIFENELKDYIGKDGYRKFERFMDEHFALESIENEEYFVQGFCLANKLRDESLIK